MNKEEQVLAEFWDLFNKKIWLDAYKMKESLKDYKPSEIHCIEYIGKSEDSNVTKLAETFYMTRSAISKITKKLIEKGLIDSYQKPDNKKEIYFRLMNGFFFSHFHFFYPMFIFIFLPSDICIYEIEQNDSHQSDPQ